MKHIITAIFCLFQLTTLFGQPRYKYNIEKVTDDIYVLEPDINDYRWVTSNIVIIINENDVFVVDSGLLPSAGEAAIREIQKITDKPVRYLFNTHWHGDHWQGNGAFLEKYPGLEIITTEENFKMISRNGMVWVNRLYPYYFDLYAKQYSEAMVSKSLDNKKLDDSELKDLAIGLDQMKKDLEEIKQLRPCLPNVTYHRKMVIKEGKREIQLLYLGVGNTPGDGIVYLPEEKVLISGDLVVFPSPFESGMFSPEWLETSKKLSALDYDYLIPGHGQIQKDHKYLNYLNDLFKEIIKQVTAAYLSGITHNDDIKAKVTKESVIKELNKNPDYQQFTKQLDPGFISGALDTSIRRIIQGKVIQSN